FFFSSRRRHTRSKRDWSSDVCSSDLGPARTRPALAHGLPGWVGTSDGYRCWEAPMRIALFIACFNDVMYPRTGKAMVGLLRRLGHEVVFPRHQTCCGQMHFNTGYQDDCLPLVEHFCDVFDDYRSE